VPGAPDPTYALARKVLLDALEALGDQRRAVILVGAQAIYLHVGDADLAVAAFTTDGDLAIVPSDLQPRPILADTLIGAGFRPSPNLGTWIKEALLEGATAEVHIDLLVPELVGGPGRRGARLDVHGTHVARKAKGLEAALIDRQLLVIAALDNRDARSYELWVAGPVALLVSKLHKIYERGDAPARRQDNKDALDVLRLLRGVPTEILARSIRTLLTDPIGVVREAVAFLRHLFADPSSRGSQMAARPTAPLEPPETIAASCAALAQDLLRAVE
jgi:hypothetical protein